MTLDISTTAVLRLSAFNSLFAASARSQTGSGQAMVWLLAAAVAIGIIVGGLVLANKAVHRRRTNSHPGLFTGLCQHHKLDRARRNLLKAIGQAHRVRYPARVFLDPSLFDPKRLPPALRARKDEVLALRQQLFLVSDTVSPLEGKG